MQIFRKIHGKRGSLVIEIAIGIIIFVYVLAFLADVIVIGNKLRTISNVNNYLARTVGIQGGLASSPPSGYPSNAYVSKSQMIDFIDQTFNAAGIKSNEWSGKINGRNIFNDNHVDYGFPITTELTVNYQWNLLKHLLPGKWDGTVTSKRVVVSEFKQRYETMIGE